MRLIYFILLVPLLIFTESKAQQYTLYTSKVGLEEGLSSYNVSTVTQDQRGIIWIGTDYGLNRYDGTSIKTYTQEENHLYGNVINNVSENAQQHLWLSSLHNNKQNITIFDPITENTYSILEYTKKKPPFNVEQTKFFLSQKTESILFKEFDKSIENYRFFEYSKQEFRPIFENFKVPLMEDYIHVYTCKLKEDKYCLFTVTRTEIVDQLFILNSNGDILEQSTISGNYTLSLFGEFDGIFSISLFEKESGAIKVYLNDGDNVQWYEAKTYSNKTDYTILHKNQKIYVLSSDSLLVLDQDQVYRFEINNSFNKLGASYLDKDGNIWLNDEAHLHTLYIRKQPIQLELTEQTPNLKLRGIAQDYMGKLYTGNIGFLVMKDSTQWQDIMDVNKATFHNYLGMLPDEKGVWMGLEEGHLLYYDANTLSAKTFGQNIFNQRIQIWQPHKTKTGNIWVGTGSGLYALDLVSKNLIPFKDKGQGLQSSTIYALHENKMGTWLSTSNGLYLVDLEKEQILSHYNNTQQKENFIPTNHIAHLHEDSAGYFWLATKGNGLIQWHPKTQIYQQYTQKGAGLSSNMLYSVYGDDFDNLWMSSQRGLICFNTQSKHVQIYLKEDGLPHNEFNTISHFQNKKGRLFFGGQNGLIHFHPEAMQTSKRNYELILTDAQIQKASTDTLVDKTATLFNNSLIHFTSTDKAIILNFALLDYYNSNNHQYSYKIKGYDEDWVYQDNSTLTLRNLPYGEYQLKVRAKAASSNTWTYYSKPLNIRFVAPFYQTTWFWVLMMCLLFTSLLLIFRWRIRQVQLRKKELEHIVLERTEELRKDKALIEEQAKELKALDQLKSNFFANISHELRTPLTLILGPLSYLLEEEDAWEEKEIRRQLTTMHRNGKSLMNLIEEILDLSKLEAKKLDLKEVPIALRVFISQILEKYQAKLKNLELQIQFQYLLDQKVYLFLDRKKIEQVLNNFLSNAIKYSPSNSIIILSLYKEQEQLCFKVSDQGRGIHPSDLPYIFDRYYQAKHLSVNLEGGTGIGLALVKELASLMQGTTYVESELGQGSHFYFKIPYKLSKQQEITLPEEIKEIKEEEIESIGTDFNILVVEDNIDMQDFIVQLLSKRYTNVFRASNGREGLDVLNKNQEQVHLIVSDVMMPEIDGFTMVQQIKLNAEWSNIPIIMLTALAAERNKLKALTIGVDDYLNKPFSSAELLVRAQNLLFNYHQRNLARKEIMIEQFSDGTLPIVQEDILSVNNKEWLEELVAFVKVNLDNSELAVENLAKTALISKRQLNRKLKAITGLPPAKFIKEIRLNEARQQLEQGIASTVTEIAYNCGFLSIQSFSRSYKKRFGKMPSAYIKK